MINLIPQTVIFIINSVVKYNQTGWLSYLVYLFGLTQLAVHLFHLLLITSEQLRGSNFRSLNLKEYTRYELVLHLLLTQTFLKPYTRSWRSSHLWTNFSTEDFCSSICVSWTLMVLCRLARSSSSSLLFARSWAISSSCKKIFFLHF